MTRNILFSVSLFITILLFSSLSFGHTSVPVKIKCPIDGTTFTISETASYTTFSTLKDFQKQGAIGNLYESYVNACPKCHYSGYQKDFDTTFNTATKKEILIILDPFKHSEMTDVLENEIAVQIHLFFKRSNDDIANLYLVASYFLRNIIDETPKRKELQLNCLTYLTKAIENKEYSKKESYASVKYLIGELYRRTGDFSNAIKYYDLALSDENKKDWIVEIANQQKELALKEDDDNGI